MVGVGFAMLPDILRHLFPGRVIAFDDPVRIENGAFRDFEFRNLQAFEAVEDQPKAAIARRRTDYPENRARRNEPKVLVLGPLLIHSRGQMLEPLYGGKLYCWICHRGFQSPLRMGPFAESGSGRA